MKIFFRISMLAIIVALVLYACNLTPPTTTTTTTTNFSGDPPAVTLSVQATNASTAFNTVGQVINYSYTVTNTGNPALASPVTVTDDKTTAPACANVNTVGNANNNLDKGEAIICTSTFTITQADLNTGSVTNNATAKVAGTDSNRVTTVVPMTQNKALTITVTANPTTYSAAGQTITFTYSVKNTSTTTLGPAQFTVRDDHVSAPINCDAATRTLAPNEMISCTGTYATTQNDMGLNQFVNTATASGGGAGTVQPATSTITKLITNLPPTTPPGGSPIPHKIVRGEWLIQIARCYGAKYEEVRAANPQILIPGFILPDTTVTVPNPGSNGKNYGPPCVGFHTVQSGDTWNSIAQKYNADVIVLQAANRNATLGNGTCIKVPLNSAGGATPSPSAAGSCSIGTNPPPPNVPIRITIPTGSTSVTLPGTVEASGKVRYVFTANQGQSLTVKLLNAPANELTLGITASNGSIMKAQDATLTFPGTIPSTGDSFIDIFAVSGTTSKSFTLEVTITTPPPPPPVSSVERVADINSGINSSDPAYLSIFNGTLFFKATGSDNAGAELWKYDSTTKLASRAADIVVGAGGSDPAYLTSYNGALYFKSNGSDGAGSELWRFNGSAAGRLGDINSGAGDANPSYLAVFNNMLYFSAKGSDNAGAELWRTDGTTTVRAADINAGPGDSNPAYLTVFNNALYFSAVSADGMGVELWKYDGATATRVSDINAGIGNSNPAHLAVFNNALYFSANGNDGTGIELWKYDGTANPPTRVADINVGAGDSAPSFLTLFNNALYFSANGNDGAGIELWKYDGTTTKRVADLNTVGNSSPSYLIVFNNELYFQANGNDGTGTELWKFKGP